MNRQEIATEIERVIKKHWIYFDDDTHSKTAEEVLKFLEDIGFDSNASSMEREGLKSFYVKMHDPSGYILTSWYHFWAEDEEHAKEQAKDAESDLEIVEVSNEPH